MTEPSVERSQCHSRANRIIPNGRERQYRSERTSRQYRRDRESLASSNAISAAELLGLIQAVFDRLGALDAEIPNRLRAHAGGLHPSLSRQRAHRLPRMRPEAEDAQAASDVGPRDDARRVPGEMGLALRLSDSGTCLRAEAARVGRCEWPWAKAGAPASGAGAPCSPFQSKGQMTAHWIVRWLACTCSSRGSLTLERPVDQVCKADTCERRSLLGDS